MNRPLPETMGGPLRPRGMRLLRLLRVILVIMSTGTLCLGLLGFVAVEHTAQPEFCGSCHNMLPYIETWKESPHKDIACIRCHYEPGSLETLAGKFKAITQVAKYVTSTGGKPFAEIEDESCLRSGCHATPALEGRIPFGEVVFDHRKHLLRSGQGKELKCTSCHAHILEGEHFSVSETVCFTCHFHPEADGELPARSECTLCHRAPTQAIQVAGRPFLHRDFVARGVRCQECHQETIRGDGHVDRERCQECHEKRETIERSGDGPFLHEVHVSRHKVECFQCHSPIEHGRLEESGRRGREGIHGSPDDCRNCHDIAHDPGLAMWSGSGAEGVPDHRGRMQEIGLDCLSCHRKRSSATTHPLDSKPSDADCIHCHGPSYAGMLPRWQETIAEQSERLQDLLDRTLREAASAPEAPPALRADLAIARRNLERVQTDRSHGAHDPTYSVNVLRDVAARIDQVVSRLSGRESRRASEGLPVRSKDGCTSACHLGIESLEWVPMEARRNFPHRRHLLAAGLDCSRCHQVDHHGQPAFPRQDCASCHHQPNEDGELDCSRCHPTQAAMLGGAVEGFEPFPSPMGDLECVDCHGEAPDILRPNGQGCVMCHEEDYAETLSEWQQSTREALEELGKALRSTTATETEPGARARARRAWEIVQDDGSGGAHNPMLTESILEEGLDAIGG